LRRERDSGKRSPEEEEKRRDKIESRKTKAVELAASTFADMMADRGENDRVWASVLKEVMKRRNPGFNESYFGFRTFGNLLEEAVNRGLLAVGRDEKSGTYVMRAQSRPVDMEAPAAEPEAPVEPNAIPQGAQQAGAVAHPDGAKAEESTPPGAEDKPSSRRRGGRHSRKEGRGRAGGEAVVVAEVPVEPPAVHPEPAAPVEAAAPVAAEEAPKPRRGRRPRKEAETVTVVAEVAAPVDVTEKPKTPRRAPRSRKPKVEAES
jgi:hypothetical protein